LIIENFRVKLHAVGAYGIIIKDVYCKITGSNTALGTPLDVHYNTKDGMIYVADRGIAAG
jgi:hypothetical protein